MVLCLITDFTHDTNIKLKKKKKILQLFAVWALTNANNWPKTANF